MLIPESRRSWETASPTEPDSKDGFAREPDPTPTVLRNSGSSVRRAQAQAAPPMPLPAPGEMIGSFLLEEAIGAGGMGAVFRALDTQLDREVALKLLPPDQALDPEVVQRFYQEGRSAAQLDHENIARVFSIGQDGPFHHIAFEYIEGVTLRHRVESSGPLKPVEAVDVALQIANALVHASRRGVIHRDIKPSNIILTPQGRAKVVDMGLARRFERGGDHGLTQSGMTLGTFDYISPEQARDPRDVDVRSDLYSLGCTMFHMLTGRPPFPGGTVLQKLIQHQEEPPADVRTLNPEVPPELSAIIAKLMAKERDRRYQGPEQLVRDLLALAGSLGLERTSAELEPWMLHGHHTWWERHLVWLLPVLGFLVATAGLAWWGREFSRPPAAANGPAVGASHRASTEVKVAESPRSGDRTIAVEAAPAPGAAAVGADDPGPIRVGSSEDLPAVMSTAPRGAIIILSDAGPYRLVGRAWSAREARGAAGADLTIRAERGVRPVLEGADGDGTQETRSPSILEFIGGHVIIEGVDFKIGPSLSGDPSSAIRCDETELVVRGCSFRRPVAFPREDRDVSAILVRASNQGPRGAERPPAVFVDACHFDGGQAAVRAHGPADITLRDCTMGPAAPSIWFDRPRPGPSIPGELRLIHTSILAAAGPVFRFGGGPVRARVDDCVIAAAGRVPAALVQAETSKGLDWRGRANLYGSIAPFLTTPPRSAQPAKVPDFAAWEQAATGPRELGSRVSEVPVWDATDPLVALAQERENPTRAFVLNPQASESSTVGARPVPNRSNLNNPRLAQRLPATRAAGRGSSPVGDLAQAELQAARPAPRAEGPDRSEPARQRPSFAKDEAPPVDDQAQTPPADPMSLPAMPPMATSGGTQPEMEPESGDIAAPMPMPMPMPEPTREETGIDATGPSSSRSRPAPTASDLDEDLVRSAEQFLAVLRHTGDRGGNLRIASGVDLELPTIAVAVAAANRLQIVGEAGSPRPRLRFRPASGNGGSPTEWLALLTLRSGSLRLQGLDLIIPEPESRTADRLAAIAVMPGTELVLDDCTVTLSARGNSATALAVQPASGPARPGGKPGADGGARGATIRIRDGFLRSGGDAVLVASGGRLALTLQDVMVATEGSLLRAMGNPRAVEDRSPGAPALDVRIDRVCARVRGGLVRLQTTQDEPEMSAVEIRAEDSILGTVTGDQPLFRLEGQGQLERLRDKIRWTGHRVSYHRIKTYRRDEIVQAGVLPRIFERDDWTRAFEPTDESPILTDLKFRRPADPTVPAWKIGRDNLSPAASGTAGPMGPDPGKVPEPPELDEEP